MPVITISTPKIQLLPWEYVRETFYKKVMLKERDNAVSLEVIWSVLGYSVACIWWLNRRPAWVTTQKLWITNQRVPAWYRWQNKTPLIPTRFKLNIGNYNLCGVSSINMQKPIASKKKKKPHFTFKNQKKKKMHLQDPISSTLIWIENLHPILYVEL